MQTADLVSQLIISVFLIFGIYQFYFWCQRNPLGRPREFRTPVDDAIPYRPGWVWIYSCLYYPVIVYINFVMVSPAHFLHVAMSYVILLAAQMVFFTTVPVAIPVAWRAYNQRRDVSERFLALVQSFDDRSNSFPSMHVSVATLTTLHLLPQLGPWAWLFPVLIAVSCLFTKQHYVIDLPAGAALGWAVYEVYRLLF
ncbi:MAG: phosphatase PAP2 family protein [Verrucomicrobia bacterium]|nr:phosphatase PAP2 family protein [Verrucomicrobiota bacterium]